MHLEMARTIIHRFKQLYGDVFPEPLPLLANAVRIPSLAGHGKMSKSDAAETYIPMQDERDSIDSSVKKAFSVPVRLYKRQPGHPTKEGCNVYLLHRHFTNDNLRADWRIEQDDLDASSCLLNRLLTVEAI